MKNNNWLEWSVLIFSILVVLGVLGVLVYEAGWGPEGPPRIHVTLGEADEEAAYTSIPVYVSNDGGTTAEDVEVEAVLTRSTGEEERIRLTFPFLPHGTKYEGWATFATRTAADSLRVYVRSYRIP